MLFISCQKEDYYVEDVAILQDQTFSKTDVRVQGHEHDGMVIDNCTFDACELYISDVDCVIVQNCTFMNQKENGIRVAFGGEARYIIIDNCTFKNIGSNGIDSHEDAPDCIIKNCYFESCAQSDIGSAMSQPHHCIYWKGSNVQILNNEFNAQGQNYGNAISHRSSGIIAGNKVYGAPKYGIMYFADHPGGDTLYIENNFVYNCSNGIGITTPNIPEYHNQNVIVRFNSVSNCQDNSLYFAKDFDGTTVFQIYGNIIVSEKGEYIKTFYEIPDSFNLKSTTDIGFIDAANGNLHLDAGSQAIGYCSGLSFFPSIDIDGDIRVSTNLDAGADERN